jgi:hypothetical protein
MFIDHKNISRDDDVLAEKEKRFGPKEGNIDFYMEHQSHHEKDKPIMPLHSPVVYDGHVCRSPTHDLFPAIAPSC